MAGRVEPGDGQAEIAESSQRLAFGSGASGGAWPEDLGHGGPAVQASHEHDVLLVVHVGRGRRRMAGVEVEDLAE